jgi:hypothetical protein
MKGTHPFTSMKGRVPFDENSFKNNYVLAGKFSRCFDAAPDGPFTPDPYKVAPESTLLTRT